MSKRYVVSHGFTPVRLDPSRCRVMLARYPCPYRREDHDPALPPERVDAFGYVRREETP